MSLASLGHGPESLGPTQGDTPRAVAAANPLDALRNSNGTHFEGLFPRTALAELAINCTGLPGAPTTAAYEFPDLQFGDRAVVDVTIVSPKYGAPLRVAMVTGNPNDTKVAFSGNDIDPSDVPADTPYNLTAMVGGAAFTFSLTPDVSEGNPYRELRVACTGR